MNLPKKLLITIIFIIAFLTDVISIVYIQSIHAYSLDLGNVHRNFDSSQGHPETSCPNQSHLKEQHTDSANDGDFGGKESVIPTNPSPNKDPTLVCIP